MLGISMSKALQNFELIVLSRQDLDISCFSKVRKQLYTHQPDYIINCAAYTEVDLAESQAETAYKINSRAVGMLAQLAKEIQATLIHFSTDYVFDGSATSPYKPTASTNPINVYGASKLQGEKAIQRSGVKHYIFRISWLYAPHGKNFFRWVMENDRQEMNVVDNQTGCPTSAIDVANFVNHIIHNDPNTYGTYHFTNTGNLSWFAFAKAIATKAGLQKNIIPVSHFPTAAKRPAFSLLECSLTEHTFNYDISSTHEALDSVYSTYKLNR